MLPWQHSPRKQCRGLSTNSPARKLWPHNQPQENQCECPRCQPSPCNQNRRRHSRCSRRIHLVGSTVLMNLSLDSEISRRMGKATGTMSKLTKRAWENKFLTENAQMHIYQACVLSKLLYSSETWTTYRNAAWTLSTCYASTHLRHQVAIPHPQQWDTVTCWFPQHALPPQSAPPEMAGTCSSHGWWAHPQESFIRTINNRSRESRVRRPAVHRRLQTWPQSMRNWSKQLGRCCDWSCSLETDSERRNEKANVKRHQKAEEKRARRKKSSTLPSFNHICPMCRRDCHSRIDLHGHTWSCRTTIDWLGRTCLVSRDFTCPLARISQGGGWGNIQDRSGISMPCFTKSEEWVLCFTT